jgi:hypothetical protein
MLDHFGCPKCGRRLARSGEIAVEGKEFPVFQCDECLKTVEMFGEPFEVALTFAVDEQGRAFDPAEEDDELRP